MNFPLFLSKLENNLACFLFSLDHCDFVVLSSCRVGSLLLLALLRLFLHILVEVLNDPGGGAVSELHLHLGEVQDGLLLPEGLLLPILALLIAPLVDVGQDDDVVVGVVDSTHLGDEVLDGGVKPVSPPPLPLLPPLLVLLLQLPLGVGGGELVLLGDGPESDAVELEEPGEAQEVGQGEQPGH